MKSKVIRSRSNRTIEEKVESEIIDLGISNGRQLLTLESGSALGIK